jgi:L-alanine-DL-glutamate epimerase-like enolase superfamily enzyme
MTLYERAAELPIEVDSYELENLDKTFASGFERPSTLIKVHGGGATGLGEDVTYEAEAHDAQIDAGPILDLAGQTTFHEFSQRLERLDLFPGFTPQMDVFRRYRRWGFESAALDLALRQAGTSLHDLLGRTPEPVTFVVSSRMGDPPTLAPVTRRLERYPNIRFKLDATPDWTDELIEGLQRTGAVDSIDFKGTYKGTIVDTPTDPAFYRKIAEAFPDAWLEDPDLETDEARNALAPHQDRITWDAPIHDVADILAAPVMPRTVNLKPSRFGSVQALFAGYEFCEQRGMGAYGGGQYELGVGRGHVQLLAALFHPNAPNDIAPGGYDMLDPEPGLPESPLDVDPAPLGFRRNID